MANMDKDNKLTSQQASVLGFMKHFKRVNDFMPTYITPSAGVKPTDKYIQGSVTPTMNIDNGNMAETLKNDINVTSSKGVVIGLAVGLTLALGVVLSIFITVGVLWYRKQRRSGIRYFSSPVYIDPSMPMNSIENEDLSL